MTQLSKHGRPRLKNMLAVALLAGVALPALVPGHAMAQAPANAPDKAPAAAEAPPPPPPGEAGRPMRGPMHGPMGWFHAADTNKDGQVTWDEAWALIQKQFNEMDKTHSGSVTLAEFIASPLFGGGRPPGPPPEAGHNRPPGGPEGERGPRHDRMGPMMHRPFGPSPEMVARFKAAIFRAADANRDGKVTLAELQPIAEAFFRSLDVNGDKVITLDELPVPMRHRGPPPPPPGGPRGEGPQGERPHGEPRR